MRRFLAVLLALLLSIVMYVFLVGPASDEGTEEQQPVLESTPAPDRERPRLAGRGVRRVGTDGPATLELELDVAARGGDIPVGCVLLRIIDAHGTPVPRSTVTVETLGAVDGSMETYVCGSVSLLVLGNSGDRIALEVKDPRDEMGRTLNLLPVRIESVGVDDPEVCVVLSAGRSLRGIVRTAEGEPLADVVVRAAPPARFSASRTASTSPDGTFAIGGLPDGVLEIRITDSEQWLPIPPIRVEPERDSLEIELHLARTFRIEVVDAAGVFLPQHRMEVAWWWNGRRWDFRNTTDAEGSLLVPRVPGDARFEIRTDSGRGSALPDVTEYDVPYGMGTHRVTLPQAVAIEGSLVDRDGEPVRSATVVTATRVVEDGRGPRSEGRTNDGRFHIDRLAPGRYILTTMSSQNHASIQPTEVVAPTHGLVLTLPWAAVARGRLLGANPQNVYVCWHGPHDMPRAGAVDASGVFEIPGLRDDVGALYALRGPSHECFLREGIRPGDGPFEVRLVPALTIAGRLVSTSQYVARRCSLVFLRGPVLLRGSCRLDGSFETRGIPEGQWRVECRLEGRCLAARDGVEAGRTDVVLRIQDAPIGYRPPASDEK